MKYAYHFISESGDRISVESNINYETALEFMKNEFVEEYNAWKLEDYDDDAIPYCEFVKLNLKTGEGIEDWEDWEEDE